MAVLFLLGHHRPPPHRTADSSLCKRRLSCFKARREATSPSCLGCPFCTDGCQTQTEFSLYTIKEYLWHGFYNLIHFNILCLIFDHVGCAEGGKNATHEQILVQCNTANFGIDLIPLICCQYFQLIQTITKPVLLCSLVNLLAAYTRQGRYWKLC